MEAWQKNYDRWRLASPPEAPYGNYVCTGCGANIAWEGEFPDDCLACGEPTEREDEDARAEDAAIEAAERRREDMMFDRESWDD